MTESVKCPECGGDTDVDPTGRVVAHNEWRVGPGGMHQSRQQCAGTGMVPEATSAAAVNFTAAAR